MKRTLCAPGKVMWLGEYVVLDGAPALVAAVDRHATCQIAPPNEQNDRSIKIRSSLNDQTWILRDKEGSLHAPNDPSFELIFGVQQHLQNAEIPLPTDGCTLYFDSSTLSDDQKLGLGSSAAIAALSAVALADPSAWKTRDPRALFELTHQAHQDFQGGVGSGSDVAAACMGGVLRMQKGSKPTPVPTPSIHTLVVYTGHAADTAQFVRAVRDQMHRTVVKHALDRMARASEEGVLALDQKNTASFLDAVRTFHAAEVQLTQASSVPIVTSEIAQIVESMERCGGAAKASGAGGGDIVIAFFEDADAPLQAAQHAEKAGFQVIELSVEPRGVLA